MLERARKMVKKGAWTGFDDERQSLIFSMCGQMGMKWVSIMHKSHSEERGTGFLPVIEKIIKALFLGQGQAGNKL